MLNLYRFHIFKVSAFGDAGLNGIEDSMS